MFFNEVLKLVAVQRQLLACSYPRLLPAAWVAYQAWKDADDRIRHVVLTIVAFCILVISAHVVAALWPTHPLTSRLYHAETVYALNEGYDPYTTRRSLILRPGDRPDQLVYEAVWIVQAATLDVTHSIDSVNRWLLVAARCA